VLTATRRRSFIVSLANARTVLRMECIANAMPLSVALINACRVTTGTCAALARSGAFQKKDGV